MATLLGEWGFLDNLADTSGNGHAAVFSQSGAQGYDFVAGPQTGTRAFRFKGTGQRLEYGRTGLEPASLGVSSMAWVKAEASWPAGYTVPLAKALASASTRYGSLVSAGNFAPRARWSGDLHFTETGGALGVGTWRHLAVVDGDTKWVFYLDGTPFLNGTRAVTGTGHFENFPWGSGNPTGNLGESFNGLCITGARIFHGELTQTEVTTWKDTPITGLPAQPWTDVYVGATRADAVYVGATKVR